MIGIEAQGNYDEVIGNYVDGAAGTGEAIHVCPSGCGIGGIAPANVTVTSNMLVSNPATQLRYGILNEGTTTGLFANQITAMLTAPISVTASLNPLVGAARLAATASSSSALTGSSATETAFSQSYTIPAGDSWVGRLLHVHARGVYTTVTTAPTLQLNLRYGATNTTPIVCGMSGAFQTIPVTGQPWSFDCDITVRALGSGTSGSFWGNGRVDFSAASTAVAATVIDLRNGGVGLDTTTATALTLFAKWATNNVAGDTITMEQFWVDAN